MKSQTASESTEAVLSIDTPVWLPESRTNLIGRVSVWRGVSVVGAELVLRGYAPDAWVPDFGKAAPTSVPPVVASVSTPTQWVSVVQVPEEILARGRAAAADRSTDRHTLLATFSKLLLESTNESVRSGSGVHPLGFARRDAGRLTTTWDRQKERYIGLHIDSWDRAPIATRGKSRNRICLNLGEGPRSLLFVPTSITRFASTLSVDQSVLNASDIGRAFMASDRDVLIVEVTTMPGEAYVAPTETIIHDGSTRFADGTDLSFTVLGHFSHPLTTSSVRFDQRPRE